MGELFEYAAEKLKQNYIFISCLKPFSILILLFINFTIISFLYLPVTHSLPLSLSLSLCLISISQGRAPFPPDAPSRHQSGNNIHYFLPNRQTSRTIWKLKPRPLLFPSSIWGWRTIRLIVKRFSDCNFPPDYTLPPLDYATACLEVTQMLGENGRQIQLLLV